MTQHEKLERFQDAIFREIDEKAEQICREAEQQKIQKIEENRQSRQFSIAVNLQQKTQEIRKEVQRETAEYRLAAKRNVLSYRQQCVDALFAEAERRLTDFRASDDYAPYLAEALRAFGEKHPLEGVCILLAAEDLPLADMLAGAYPCACTFAADPAIRLGGFAVKNETDHLYFDETFEQKLRDQKSAFSLHNELFV